MEDIKRLYQILMDYTYNNKVLLEIELNKISDKRLVIGFLTDILGKLEDYEADKEIIISTLSLFINSDDILNKKDYSENLLEYNKFYLEEMKKHRIKREKHPPLKTIKKSLELITILKDSVGEDDKINPLEVPEFVKGVKECSEDEIDDLKKLLINIEFYSVIVDIEKIVESKNTI